VLNWLRDIVAPLRMTDPELGPLRYSRDMGGWEGRLAFSPTNTDVEIFLLGPPSGPSETQRAFFREVSRRYEELWTLVHAEVCGCKGREGGTHLVQLVLEGITLRELGTSGPPRWELWYKHDPPDELDSRCVVDIEGWKPVDVWSADD
jgi:hypothetical protein